VDGDRYILGVKGHPETFTEVSEEEFIRAESGAGFRSKFGPGRVATGGFSTGTVQGSVVASGFDFDEYLEWIKGEMRGPTPQYNKDKFHYRSDRKG